MAVVPEAGRKHVLCSRGLILVLLGIIKMAIDLEGVDRDGRDADAQGDRKDELQFTLEQ